MDVNIESEDGNNNINNTFNEQKLENDNADELDSILSITYKHCSFKIKFSPDIKRNIGGVGTVCFVLHTIWKNNTKQISKK